MVEPFSADSALSEGTSVLTKVASVVVRHLPSKQQAQGNVRTRMAVDLIDEVKGDLDVTSKTAFWYEYDRVEAARKRAEARPGLFGYRATHAYNDRAGNLHELALVTSTQTKAEAARRLEEQTTEETAQVQDNAPQPNVTAPAAALPNPTAAGPQPMGPPPTPAQPQTIPNVTTFVFGFGHGGPINVNQNFGSNSHVGTDPSGHYGYGQHAPVPGASSPTFPVTGNSLVPRSQGV